MFVRASLYIRPFGLQKRRFASAASEFRIPVIDFSKFRAAKSDAEKKDTANEIVSAFKNSGFIYISNHGLPQETVSKVFQKSADFFKMPEETKARLAWEDPRANRGWVQSGRERVTQSADAAEILALREKAPDFKESMEIGRDWDSHWKNQWPEEADAPGFKQTMLDFFQTCHNLHTEIMRSIALGLDLSEDFFDRKIDKQCHNLRLLSYPPIKRSLIDGEGQARAGAHSDYGTLTLLFQDSVGGLEVLSPHTGEFIAATPIPKVISSTETITPARQSIAFFSNPNFDAEIACLPNCGKEAKYPAINTETYIVGRLAATYM
ncbi:Clavaminate synthase-like protein [Gymnopus androsaceus JB14]|uniref:Clavaminate synthase-like protein n=1 Tax=Gymnopus androsaceus JB14 TaxID=1447944 RepID=A0A6A4ILS2_9AGAR|nr:Clavaminate synthase-like protein [Gymnopus androsaceus JB14]